MSKRLKNLSISRLKVTGVFLSILAFWGLLGAFSLTWMGQKIYSWFSFLLGEYGWIGIFACWLLAFFLWHLAKRPQKLKGSTQPKLSGHKSPKTESKDIEDEWASHKFPLPSTKLVPVRGFDQYFSQPELLEIDPAVVVDNIKELGHNFPSYFGEGEISFRSTPKLSTLQGLRKYFETVDQEVLEEADSNDKNTTFSPQETAAAIMFDNKKMNGQSYPGQVANLFQKTQNGLWEGKLTEELGVTISERETLLGKQKLSNKPNPEPTLILEKELPEKQNTFEKKDFLNPGLRQNTRNKLEEKKTNDEQKIILEQTEENINLQADLQQNDFLNNIISGPEKEISETELISKKQQWQLPDLDLLDPRPPRKITVDTETPRQLETALQNFGVKAKVIRTTRGPVITRYELAPAPGVKISRIVNLADDIALALAARDVRIEAPIPGKAAIGIEVPNKQVEAVTFSEVLGTNVFKQNQSKLKVALGKDIADQPVIADLAKMPHLLIAGATGSGKSVCVTTLINSLLFNASPTEVKLLLIDPKMVELSHYNGIGHLLAPVVTDPKKASTALKWIVKEMENRYELFAAAGVRDIERFNKIKGAELPDTPALPWIVVIIDELADLMLVAAGEVEEAICRLAQMARAAGIHLVIATQRPSVDVITGVIKANIPSRISFAVTSQIDSRTILDMTGAEKLLGKGDMLYSPQGLNKPLRVQGCFVSDDEVQRIINHWHSQGRPEYLDPERLFSEESAKNEESGGPDDELFFEAGKLFITTGMASVSFLQRKLKLGYARAARLMDLLEEQGVVGGYEGTKPRQVLLSIEEFSERFGG